VGELEEDKRKGGESKTSKEREEWNSFKKCKQLFECQHLLLLRDIWWSKF
jgi:hypothetical protein